MPGVSTSVRSRSRDDGQLTSRWSNVLGGAAQVDLQRAALAAERALLAPPVVAYRGDLRGVAARRTR